MKIKSISEAYSMQPVSLSLCECNHTHIDICIEKIEIENQGEFYIGFNFKGQNIFKYRSDSVNVHYFNPNP